MFSAGGVVRELINPQRKSVRLSAKIREFSFFEIWSEDRSRDTRFEIVLDVHAQFELGQTLTDTSEAQFNSQSELTASLSFSLGVSFDCELSFSQTRLRA